MKRVKIWKPFLHFKLVEKMSKVPIFSRMLNKIIDKFQIVRNEAWANVRCVCCGGFVGSVRSHLHFGWVCIPSETGEKCEYYGKLKGDCIHNPNCVLRTDKEVVEKRKYFFKVIRSEILEIFHKFGVCIIDKENEEVYRSLAGIRNDFTIYGFRGKVWRYNAYKEGDEIVYKTEEVDTTFLILYPKISYRLLKAKVKLLNTDEDVLRDAYPRLLKMVKSWQEA